MISTLALAGCGSSHHSDNNTGTPSQTSSTTVASKPAKPSETSYKLPDWGKPSADYVSIKNNNTLMFYYYANTGMPADYHVIASNEDAQYRSTSNVFTKHKLLHDLKPILDRKLAYAKAHPYAYWPMYQMNLGNYSFKRHGFPMANTMLISSGTISYDQWASTSFSLETKNHNAFSFLPVKNKKLAKKIESFISADDAIYVKPYLFINGASLSNNTVKAICTKIAIYGPEKQLLMTYSPRHS